MGAIIKHNGKELFAALCHVNTAKVIMSVTIRWLAIKPC